MVSEEVLFIGDKSIWSKLASEFLEENFSNVTIILWERGESYPPNIDSWVGDRIFSFKSDLVLSKAILENTQKSALNFHPSPPQYRGVGGYKYAIYNNDLVFGVTCHHMIEKVDVGRIIMVHYFPILNSEKASSLEKRAGAYSLILLYQIVQLIISGESLPESGETWQGKLRTHKQLQEFIDNIKSINPQHNSIM